MKKVFWRRCGWYGFPVFDAERSGVRMVVLVFVLEGEKEEEEEEVVIETCSLVLLSLWLFCMNLCVKGLNQE